MGIWSTIAYRLREVVSKMIGSRTIEQTLHVTPAISSEMENSIELWSAMYEDKAPWLKEPTPGDPSRVTSLGLPALIASEKARTALLEFKSEITAPTKEVEIENPEYAEPEPDEFGNVVPSAQPKFITKERPVGPTERAEYLNEQYEKLKDKLRVQIEYGIAKGGLVIKPYVSVAEKLDENGALSTVYEMNFDFVQADCFFPLAFDDSSNITEAAFIQTKQDKDTIYRRLEYHKWSKGVLTVENRAYKSIDLNSQSRGSSVDLGQEIALTDVPEWANLQRTTVINNVERPLFAYFKMPEANTIDTKSPLGVSGYSRVVNLIKDADLQYSRLLWEYEGGELAIDIDRDALNFIEQSGSILNNLQSRLYRKVDVDVEGGTFEHYAPTLRDMNYINGLNTILMRIEDATGLSRGVLSDVTQEARTATEIKILKQRSYQTNELIQRAIESTLKDVIYVMNAYCDLYEITPPGEHDVNFEWDDSIIVDVDTELTKLMSLMDSGIVSKLEVRKFYFGETDRQAQEALLKVEEENRASLESEMIVQSNMNRQGEA